MPQWGAAAFRQYQWNRLQRAEDNMGSNDPVAPDGKHVTSSESNRRESPSRAQPLLEKVALVLALLGAVLILTLLFRLSFADITIGTATTPSDAVVRANERLVQMVQWTIGTVLTLGGALIGLNWYQNERRYERDREGVDHALKAARDAYFDIQTTLRNNEFEMRNLRHDFEMHVQAQVLLRTVEDVRSGSRSIFGSLQEQIEELAVSPATRKQIATSVCDNLRSIRRSGSTSYAEFQEVDKAGPIIERFQGEFPEIAREARELLDEILAAQRDNSA